MKNKKNKKDSTRRKFLKMGLTVGAGSIAGAGLFSSCSKSELENEEMIKVLSVR